MTTITMRHIGEAFLVTGKDIEARNFASRREAKDWCASHYPGSPIHEIGALLQAKEQGYAAEGTVARAWGHKIKNPAESGGVL